MKHTKRFLALVFACVMMTSCAFAAGDTVTVTTEEYELLQKYRRLEDIVSMVDEAFLFEYDKEKLMEYAAKGMLGALGDDYSFYYTTEQMTTEHENLDGEYGGIGFEVFANPNDQMITIGRVFYGSPAQKAGLLAGDKIIQVNGEEMTAFDLNKAVSIMRGVVGEEVTLTILRDREMMEIKCVRAVITTQIITYEMLEGDIGYVTIHYFEGNLVGQFNDMLNEFEKQGMKGLIIDLRGNPGGLLNLAVDMADIFLPEDAKVTGSEDKYGRRLTMYANDGAIDLPVVMLMDKHTASAAEILILALTENGVGKTVGVTSYGKGIVQSVFTFPNDGAGLQLTTDYWLSPEGNNIHKKGIVPDYEVELPEDALDNNFAFIREKDTQFQKAVEVMQEMLIK